ncbi:OB-fold domain-containing protein [Nocardioides sp. zg-536]|uniref:OB-fold domain-containing protein n=1 Tax=Nocardioides faecalis TaxID=2803858 RepID=A0A938Y7H6_9ACTN|nr:OB-fold domain-containing protein [Nocardioides faecalis]MBM9460627.1 OB-fold domain-containing protein [Nocardioides faecalis]QVI57454.1 OB-fold domain-containing protein [Nocardioides faecalis]
MSEAPGRPSPVRPVIGLDNAYFFEGTKAHELRIQKCNACGVLRHPPGPACPECGALDRGHVVARGEGTVFSYVVHHAPQVPGKQLPLVIALLDLDEGVRMVAEVTGVPAEGDDGLRIGDRLQVDFDDIDDELTLPIWRRVGRGEPA